mgnify:FL=1
MCAESPRGSSWLHTYGTERSIISGTENALPNKKG